MTERRYLKSVGGKTPPSELRELSGSIKEKTKRLVAANRCFRELVKTFDGFNMSPTRKAIAARPLRVRSMQQLGRSCAPPAATRGCIEARGADFHARRRFGSLQCDYTGTPPFADAEWAGPENDGLPSPYRMCEWCAGTGHPHGDEAYGMCKCPALRPNDVFGDRLVARNDDDWTKQVSEWLNSKEAIDRSEFSVQEVLESAIGWTSEHPEHKNGESRIGKLLKQMGWRKYRSWGGGVRKYLYRRPLMKSVAVSEE